MKDSDSNCRRFRLGGVVRLALVLLALVTFSRAAHAVVIWPGGEYWYSVTNNVATLWDYSGPGGAIKVPTAIAGYRVVGIGYDCFDSVQNSMTSVTLPNLVTTIDEDAFYGCSALTSITLPSTITSIGEYAFYGCSSLKSITLPNSVTSIGDDAFEECSSLTSITIPSSVTSIGDEAFEECGSLTSVTISSGVTSIGEWTFFNCSSLKSVTIPSSVTSIGEEAFADCGSLTSVTISSGVTSIGEEAFADCSSLTSITIPSSVTNIGASAFWCFSLSSVLFMGDAPTAGADIFSFYEEIDPNVTVYYFSGAQNFTTPMWNGVPSVCVGIPSVSSDTVNGGVKEPFSYQINAAASFSTSYGTSNLPAGLVCNPTTGKITGAPLNAGTFTATVTATNPVGTGTGTLTIVVAAAPFAAMTGSATGVTATGVVLSGSLYPGGQAANYYFQYGVTDLSSQTAPVSAGSGITLVDVKAAVAHLSSTTTYCYRLVVVNQGGTAYGEIGTFTTAGAPLAETGTAVPSTARTLVSGSANPLGLATAVHFQYGPVTASGTAINYNGKSAAQAAGAGRDWEAFSATLTGLKPGTTYHYRIVAANSYGTIPGSDGEFTTAGSAPDISPCDTGTGFAVSVTGTGESLADVDAVIGSQSGAASVYFQYGLKTSYGKTTGTTALISGSGCTASATLSGLVPHTVYCVRGVVQPTPGKKSYSPNATLTTLPRFDMNGDGFSELLWMDPTTGQTTLVSTGPAAVSGSVGISGTEAGPILPTNMTFCGEGEFNPGGSGYTIAWVLSGATPAQTEFLTFESGSLSVTGTSPLVTGTFVAPLGSAVAAVADIDGDGNPDLILVSSKNTVTFWLLNGFNVVAQVPGPALPAGFDIVGVDSLTSNGKLDLLLRNSAKGKTQILALNGTALASSTAGPAILDAALAGGWQLVGINVYYSGASASNGAILPNWLLYNAGTGATQFWTNVKGAALIPGPTVPAGLDLINTK